VSAALSLRWRVGLAWGVVASCSFPDVTIVQPGAGGGGTGGAGGGEPECEMADQCAQSADLCMVADCTDGECSIVPLDEGDDCSDGSGRCDADGACVECLVPEDCANDMDLCTDGFCVAEHCSNGDMDADESAEDCGGDDCLPCPEGTACNDSDDCKPLGCDPETDLCAPCQNGEDCVDSQFCCDEDGACGEQVGECVDKSPVGGTCTSAAQCTSDFCDETFVCCSTDCTGDCYSCRFGDGPGITASGTCAEVVDGTGCNMLLGACCHGSCLTLGALCL
jgi:hypothetical protein